ncbi:hypothetical protein RchiOBHm_Chr7g0242041 [Rosa chinensis]|uniref:Uncharacterized protein n=1 Tax=Rosa chinensis TaxID=74649 RepID=A0A2P6PID8_ROSCH|nr:hypothetical protein RchiOBHm_Chr7g0242041 [Rosa chinensis]
MSTCSGEKIYIASSIWFPPCKRRTSMCDVEEEYYGHGAQEMETIRNNITQSLMNARNNVNI